MKVHRSIQEIHKSDWTSSSVFTDYEFFNGLEKTRCVGEGTGWAPLFFESEKSRSFLFSYEKTHSYGEYIFDWGWAEAYHRYGQDYYPKLTSMAPFTPATVDHFIMTKYSEENAIDLLSEYHNYFLAGKTNSSHFLFINESEIPIFEAVNYLIRESFQYHFFNKQYDTFSDFLDTIKSKKAKQIRKERESLREIEFKRYSSDSLLTSHAVEMYKFYRSTISLKGAHAYLSQDFFIYLFEILKNNIVYVQASKNNIAIAGAFFLFDENRLYGRYWGALEFVKNLHFELCYYQGIDFVIEKKLSVFEAGAQGEHKIARGFAPVRTYSAHFMRNSSFHDAVNNFILDEKKQVKETLKHLESYLPFRNLE